MPEEHVVDANVLIHAADRPLPFDTAVTVPAVTAELESTDARTRFDAEDIAVYAPSEDAVETVETAAADRGEDLSDADVQVVALALDRDATVASDDYGVQNVCDALGVPYTGVVRDDIDAGVSWRTVCADCGRPVDGDACDVCGGTPKRVPADR